MAREPVQKDIDGVKYTFGRHLPEASLKLFNRIMRIVGPSMAVGIDKESVSILIEKGLDSKTKDIKLDIGSAVKVLCNHADEPEVEAIFSIILGEVIHNGNGTQKGLGNCQDNYNAVFMESGIYHVYKIIFAALGVEYNNFFGEGVSLDAIIKQAKDLIPEKPI